MWGRMLNAAAIAAATPPTLLAAPSARAAPPTPPPGNLHAVSVSDTDIVLAWSPSRGDGPVSYAVFFDTNSTPFLTSATTRWMSNSTAGWG